MHDVDLFVFKRTVIAFAVDNVGNFATFDKAQARLFDILRIFARFYLFLHLIVRVQVLPRQEKGAVDDTDGRELPQRGKYDVLELHALPCEHLCEAQDREVASYTPHIQRSIFYDARVCDDAKVYKHERHHRQIRDERLERENVGNSLLGQEEAEHIVSDDEEDEHGFYYREPLWWLGAVPCVAFYVDLWVGIVVVGVNEEGYK